MREQEMRDLIVGFLRARMRGVIFPAAVGLGLAASACSSPSNPVPCCGPPQPQDAAQGVPIYGVSFPQDAAQGAPLYGVSFPPDAAQDLPEAGPIYGADGPRALLDQVVATDTEEPSDSTPSIDSSDSRGSLDDSERQ